MTAGEMGRAMRSLFVPPTGSVFIHMGIAVSILGFLALLIAGYVWGVTITVYSSPP